MKKIEIYNEKRETWNTQEESAKSNNKNTQEKK